MPELVLIELDPALGAAEPDPEIQELIAASAGLNLGVDFLPGSLPYMPTDPPDAALAADVVWLDALVTNVDRTPRNPNLLRWHGNLYLIDHGAALYAFHGPDPLARARGAFAPIRDHVLLPAAGSVLEADARLAPTGRPGSVAALVPESWADGGVVRRVPDAAAGGAARVRRGGRACPGVSRSSTPRCGSSRAWSAARRSTPASCCSAARSASSARARSSTRRCWRALAPGLRPGRRAAALETIERIAAGDAAGGPIAALPQSERFHWLVAPSSTIVQPGPVHTGLTADPAAELEHLFSRLVERR